MDPPAVSYNRTTNGCTEPVLRGDPPYGPTASHGGTVRFAGVTVNTRGSRQQSPNGVYLGVDKQAHELLTYRYMARLSRYVDQVRLTL